MTYRSALMIGILAGAAIAAPPAAHGAEARRSAAGTLMDGTVVEAITLTGKDGVTARILTYGATLQSVIAPDREGKSADVVLGYDDVADYERKPNYFGATIGRYANRIGKSQFVLDGKIYQLPANNNGQSLHGGGQGFDKQVWRIVSVASGRQASVKLAHRSADGASGYPGQLDVTVTYSLDDKGSLSILFEAVTNKPTIVNITNHALFNMAGDGSPFGILNQRLTIPAAAYTPIDADLIPTGEVRSVAGTVFDFRAGRLIGADIRDGKDEQILVGRGYDHNFALDKGATKRPELAARLEDPVSGRVLEVLSDQPGLQLYTGNFLDGTLVGKAGRLYRMGDGIALEPQKFPDAPNRPTFLSARLDPGQTYRHQMIFRFSVARAAAE